MPEMAFSGSAVGITSGQGVMRSGFCLRGTWNPQLLASELAGQRAITGHAVTKQTQGVFLSLHCVYSGLFKGCHNPRHVWKCAVWHLHWCAMQLIFSGTENRRWLFLQEPGRDWGWTSYNLPFHLSVGSVLTQLWILSRGSHWNVFCTRKYTDRG